MERQGYIGGTDAMRIMAGDWKNLYREKMGLQEPVDLTDNFQVQLGKLTEQLHIEWVMKKLGYSWSAPKELFKSKAIPFMAGHLDGWIKDINTFIEVKHTNEWQTVSEKARYYMPQLQHYLYITEKTQCFFSVIRGNQDPDHVTVKADPDYQGRLIERIRGFWWHIENETEPMGDEVPLSEQEADKKLADNVPVDGLRKVDMGKNNQWVALSSTYLETADAAIKHDEAKKQLKELMASDIGEAYGNGIIIKRDKRGSLRFTKEGESK